MGKVKLPNVDGTAGNDNMLVGYTDVDLEQISNAAERIYGYGGDDTIYSGGGDDWIYGGVGDDELGGGTGNDRLYGENGNDLMFGGAGNDQLRGGRGNDTIYGGDDDDKIYGNKGNNELFGGSGNDLISSGDQTSTLNGGSGDDDIYLRAKKGGDHTATGGTGADEFHFQQMSLAQVSDMTVTDFVIGTDYFTIDGVDAHTYFDTALYNVSGNATVTVLTTNEGDTITFQGVNVSDFANEYIFDVA